MYVPRPSHYTPVPPKRWIRHPLDAEVFRAYHVRKSANVEGRRIRFPENFNWQWEDITSDPAPLAELPLYIDSSMLSTWRSCARKHYWSTIRGLYPTGKSVHLVAGAALAAGLEAARRFVFAQNDPPSTPLSDILMAAYPAFCYEWGDYEPPADNPRNAKTYVNVFSALVHYLTEYHPAHDPIQPLIRPDGTPAVEYRFSIPLPILHPSGDPFVFVGRFDLLGNYHFNHQQIPVICDEKTTSSFTYDWAEKWDLRGQFMGYIWALRAQGIDISHAVVRGIAIQKTQFDVRTALVQYPDHMISAWEKQLFRDVEAIKNHYLSSSHALDLTAKRETYSPNFADSCDSYGGCAFRTLCNQRDPEDFTSNYTPYRWNPLARQPVEESSS